MFSQGGLPGPETEVLTKAAGRLHAGRVAGVDPRFCAKICLPLILGICVALVAKNTSPNQYERWAGAASSSTTTV